MFLHPHTKERCPEMFFSLSFSIFSKFLLFFFLTENEILKSAHRGLTPSPSSPFTIGGVNEVTIQRNHLVQNIYSYPASADMFQVTQLDTCPVISISINWLDNRSETAALAVTFRGTRA